MKEKKNQKIKKQSFKSLTKHKKLLPCKNKGMILCKFLYFALSITFPLSFSCMSESLPVLEHVYSLSLFLTY